MARDYLHSDRFLGHRVAGFNAEIVGLLTIEAGMSLDLFSLCATTSQGRAHDLNNVCISFCTFF